MRSFKTFIKEAPERRDAPDENRFIDKHMADVKDHPVAKDDQFKSNAKKAKRPADHADGEDKEVYEEAETHKTKDGRTAKKGLYYYINKKKERGEKPNPKGHPDRPDEDDFKAASKTAKEEVEISESVIDDLRKIVKTKSANTVKFANGGKTKVDMFTASAMVKVYDALNDANKTKYADSINKDERMFMKMMDFAMSKVK